MSDVKRRNKRSEKARRTRRRMLEAARELFVRSGYGATTLQDVADQAGVAVQTIYFTFGTKRGLLKEMVDVVIAGDDEPVATMERPWFQAILAAQTAGEALRELVYRTRLILERYAPVDEVVRAAAATDPEVAGMWPRESDPRYVVQRAVADSLVTKPGVRQDVTAEHAADLLYCVLSPEVYLLFVHRRGWTPQAFEAWAYETLHPQLCGDTR